MTTLRVSAFWFGLVALAACGSDAQVNGPSLSNPATGFPQLSAGAPAPATSVAVGPESSAANAEGSLVVARSMVIPKKTAMPVGSATPGAPGAPGVPAANMAPPPPPMVPLGDMKPIIPEVAGDCPNFDAGAITYMGLGGIMVSAGAKPAAPTAPMVFYWHGTGSTAGEYAGMAAAVVAGVSQEGGVLVSFQGSTGGDLLSGTAVFGAGDFEITDQLLACAVRDRNVDPRRVFATGCSAGGLFSAAMGAARSNYMAAIAPNSGGFTVPVAWQNGWTPALMTVHGAPGVDVVAVDFSQTSATADMAYKQRGGFVINCNHGSAHCGGGGLAGNIWEFFRNHPYGASPSPWVGGLPSSINPVCKIF